MSVSVRVPPPFSGWSLSLYPGAGEAGGCFIAAGERRHSVGVKGAAADPERAAHEAGRRAKSRLRRYCAHNRLNRLGTLTYGPPRCTDPRELRVHVASFFRQLRAVRGKPFPYVWVPEVHKDGVHFHVHFAVGSFIPRGQIDTAWGRGWVHIKQLNDLPVGSGAMAESRVAANYLSKYVSKSFLDTGNGVIRPPGLHRFDVAQGFKPSVVKVPGTSRDEVIEHASGAMGGRPARLWTSDEVDDWKAPPALWLQWDGR
ncbi:rolling circle replication-associated protein [Knoellia flava]|uniref:Replication-associated protein ORF2/G2P domain-containing protein n=1 Tax=Knoellia flava TaxID=913969 RepID=A0A8H9FWP4_9MICO|nr:hypothetical protein GCM10011314_30420 [Knoellia flava]